MPRTWTHPAPRIPPARLYLPSTVHAPHLAPPPPPPHHCSCPRQPPCMPCFDHHATHSETLRARTAIERARAPVVSSCASVQCHTPPPLHIARVRAKRLNCCSPQVFWQVMKRLWPLLHMKTAAHALGCSPAAACTTSPRPVPSCCLWLGGHAQLRRACLAVHCNPLSPKSNQAWSLIHQHQIRIWGLFWLHQHATHRQSQRGRRRSVAGRRQSHG